MRVIRWKNSATGVESLNITATGIYFPVGKEDGAFVARYVMAAGGQTASIEDVRSPAGDRVGNPSISVSGTTEAIARNRRSLAYGIAVTAISGTLTATLDDLVVRTNWPDNLGRFTAKEDADAYTYGGTGLDGCSSTIAGVPSVYRGPGVGWVAQKGAKQRVYAGVRAVVIGDSQTACDTPYNINLSMNCHASSWFTFMANASGGKIVLLKNVAIGGQRTDQMLARFATDVLPCDPDVVFIAASINDGNLPGKEVDGIANHIAMHNLCKQYRSARCPDGIAVVFVTTPPVGTYALNNATVADNTLISNYNVWKQNYCATNNIPLIDFNLFYADAQGSYKNGVTTDGVHPVLNPWQKDSGIFAWNAISSFFPQPAILLPKSNTDPNNLMTNGMLLPAKSGAPAGWGTYGEAAVTQTVEAFTGHRGVCLKVVNAGASNRYNDSPEVSLSGKAGHKLRLSCTCQGGFACWKWVGGALNNSVAFSVLPSQAITSPFEQISEVIVPADATSIRFNVTTPPGSTSYISALGVYDLTARGIA